jgi:hypothetical protein
MSYRLEIMRKIDRGLLLSITPSFTRRDSGEPRITSVRLAGLLDKKLNAGPPEYQEGVLTTQQVTVTVLGYRD